MEEDYTIDEEEEIAGELRRGRRGQAVRAAREAVKKKAVVMAKKAVKKQAKAWLARAILWFIAGNLPTIIGVLLVLFIIIILINQFSDIAGKFFEIVDMNDVELSGTAGIYFNN